MAEETPQLDEYIGANHDDMSVMNYLLQTVKGISNIAGSPLEAVAVEEDADY